MNRLEWGPNRRPDYKAVIEQRQQRYLEIYDNEDLIAGSNLHYKTNPVEWVEHWGITYDPRNSGTDTPTIMPFVPFERQKEWISFLYECWKEKENGASEKCRDVGATWGAVNFAYWLFKYHAGSSVGFGSRKEMQVDRLGDASSIFEKIRILIRNLPNFCKPVGFVEQKHVGYLKIINPENGASIIGEAGDEIGRGGRTSIYFKDESAHYVRAENIEAALGDNTDCQIDLSSVNGQETVFQRKIDTGVLWSPGKKIKSGETRIFIFDWRDHPLKTQEWYNKREAKAIREGLLHKFRQEVDRDAAASLDGKLIEIEWLNAAIDAHKKLKLDISGQSFAGMDVADEGQDSHALGIRKSILLTFCKDWNQGDTGEATRESLFHLKRTGTKIFNYDAIGVGAGVKSEINRLRKAKLLDKGLKVSPWWASGKVKNPKARIIPGDGESPTNEDFFQNRKAQAWWDVRTRCQKVYKMINGEADYSTGELISFDSKIKDLQELIKQLSQVTYIQNPNTGKVMIDKKPKGSRSPNKADAVVICYNPVIPKRVII